MEIPLLRRCGCILGTQALGEAVQEIAGDLVCALAVVLVLGLARQSGQLTARQRVLAAQDEAETRHASRNLMIIGTPKTRSLHHPLQHDPNSIGQELFSLSAARDRTSARPQ
jgi:hypothetical protein